jgi:hypothetical protein
MQGLSCVAILTLPLWGCGAAHFFCVPVGAPDRSRLFFFLCEVTFLEDRALSRYQYGGMATLFFLTGISLVRVVFCIVPARSRESKWKANVAVPLHKKVVSPSPHHQDDLLPLTLRRAL